MPGVVSRAKRVVARSPRAYHAASVANTLARFAARRLSEPDFAAFAQFGDREGIFLDVGANQGQSALSFRLVNRRMPILSIEANAFHDRQLQRVRRLASPFEYMICAAGTTERSATLYVPSYRGVRLTGEASLDADEARNPWWVEQQGGDVRDVTLDEVPVQVRRLDDLGLHPAFVKIDVEGAEGEVLGGLTETIERHRPVFLTEAASSRDDVGAFFAERDYRPLARDANGRLGEPRDRSTQNLFYVPVEQGIPASG